MVDLRFSPPESRRLRASSRSVSGCLCRGCTSQISALRCYNEASSPRSPAPRFGDGSPPTPSGLGATARGSFPAIPISSPRPVACWTWYARQWEGKPLGVKDFVISADEKTSIQARHRCHPTLPPSPRRIARVEHEYERRGALAYLAAWDCGQAKIFGRCETTTGIEPFRRLVDQVMRVEPYASAERVFWVVDNGSSHRGASSACRLTKDWPNAHLVHLPIHASWLNQVEIYFSVIQRKVLDPNDVANLNELQQRLLDFQRLYQKAAKPFEWKFTRQDLAKLLHRVTDHDRQRAA
jgi:hypothetical protein